MDPYKLLQLGLLLSLASGFAAIIIYITGVSNPSVYGSYQLTDDEIEALLSLQNSFQQCVDYDYRTSSAFNSPFWTTNSGASMWNNNSSLTVGSRGITYFCNLQTLYPGDNIN
ncbi:hypothetical protein QN277_024841 [Acacia crassicarpa]|uniref:Uncharacterized protein n=1 Tax=Acacia crassicarpa TaxID=499986 RepID=A0AAE1MPI9_9FABA|nr:hypothetical protein QN277_024841 [Acacia crassicarpa]